jgi:hypothetical protein
MDRSVIHGCIDFLSDYDKVNPCPNHLAGMEKWFDEYDYDLESSLPPNEIDMSNCINGIQRALSMFVSNASSNTWSKLSVEERKQIVEDLLSNLQVQQRSTEWYAQSKLLLTASEFSNILGTSRAVASVALKKAAPVSHTNSNVACSTAEMCAFDWGIRFEPVVKQVLTSMWGCKIVDVGRFVHPIDTRLAASPDGIILDALDPSRVGRLLEIKCPVRREIDGSIPFDYWCQMQIQMEVTSIDECEYVEMKILSGYKDAPYVAADSELGLQYFGTIWLFQCSDTLELKYAYNHLERKDLELLGWNCLETIPWHIEKVFNKVVFRDRSWFEGTKQKQEEFWLRVADAHKGLIEQPKRRTKSQVVQVCQIMDSVT